MGTISNYGPVSFRNRFLLLIKQALDARLKSLGHHYRGILRRRKQIVYNRRVEGPLMEDFKLVETS